MTKAMVIVESDYNRKLGEPTHPALADRLAAIEKDIDSLFEEFTAKVESPSVLLSLDGEDAYL